MRVLLLPGKSSALQQRLGCPLVSFPHSVLNAGVLTAEVFTFSDSSSPFSPCTLLPLLQAFMCCEGRAHLADQCFVWDGQTLWWTLPLNAGLKDNPYPFLCSFLLPLLKVAQKWCWLQMEEAREWKEECFWKLFPSGDIDCMEWEGLCLCLVFLSWFERDVTKAIKSTKGRVVALWPRSPNGNQIWTHWLYIFSVLQIWAHWQKWIRWFTPVTLPYAEWCFL